MHPEKVGFEDCDLNSIFKVIDKDTQTNEASNAIKKSDSISKSYKLPLPRELEKPDEGTLKVFSFCQIIQDPDCPRSITIVRESVTEEVHTHSDSPNDEAFSNRYRYCKEVIKPYLRDYPPDCPDSGELLLRDAIITANEEFPEYPPCYEVPDPIKDSETKPDEKKSDKDTPTKKPKQSDDGIKSEKSGDHISPKKPKLDEKKEKKHFLLCPGTPEPKICIEITDPKICAEVCGSGFLEDEKESDGKRSEDERRTGKRKDKSYGKKSDYQQDREQSGTKRTEGGDRTGKLPGLPVKPCDRKSCSQQDREESGKKRTEGGDRTDKLPGLPVKPCERKSCSQQDREESGKKRTEGDDRIDTPKDKPCGRKSGYQKDREGSDDDRTEKPRDKPCKRKSSYQSDIEKSDDDRKDKPRDKPCERKSFSQQDREESGKKRTEGDDRTDKPCGRKSGYQKDREGSDCDCTEKPRDKPCERKSSYQSDKESSDVDRTDKPRDKPCERKSGSQQDREGSAAKRLEDDVRTDKPKCYKKKTLDGQQDREGSDDGHTDKSRDKPFERKSSCQLDRERSDDSRTDKPRDKSSEIKSGYQSNREGSDAKRLEDDVRTDKPKCYKKKTLDGQQDREGSDDGRTDKPRDKPCERKSSCQLDRERSDDGRTDKPQDRPSERKSGYQPHRETSDDGRTDRTWVCSKKKTDYKHDKEGLDNSPTDKPSHPEKPPTEKGYKKPSQVLPPKLRPNEDDEDYYCPTEVKDQPPPPKSGKGIVVPRQENKPWKSEKNGSPPNNTDDKTNSNKKDPPPRRDCLSKLLDSFKIKKVDKETCTRKPSTGKMDQPSENPPKKCKPRTGTPPGSDGPGGISSGIPIDKGMREMIPDRKVCKCKSTKTGGKYDEEKGNAGNADGRKGNAGNADGRKGNAGNADGRNGNAGNADGKKGNAGNADGRKGNTGNDEPCGGVQGQNRSGSDRPITSVSSSRLETRSSADGKKIKSAMDAHNETMATLKCAMEDFMCKVFRSTQDAVTLITKESAKQFEKLKKSGSNTDCPPPKKVADGPSRDNLRRFSLVNVDRDVPKNKLLPCVPPVNDVHSDSNTSFIGNLVSKVDSALSMISSTLTIDLPKPARPSSFNDVSSKYDIPSPTRPVPKDIEMVLNPAGTSSLFTTIKDKLWSIFIEDDTPENTSRPSSTNSSASSDEDLINKLID